MLILHGLVPAKPILKRILGKQKRAARIMSSNDISIPSKRIPNKHSTTSFMFKVKNSITPRVFNQVFSLIDHLYPTGFSDNSFKTCDFNLKLTRFAIGFRGPTIWSEFLMQSEKCYTKIDVFKSKIKGKILIFSNELLFFKIRIIASNSLFLLYKTKYF